MINNFIAYSSASYIRDLTVLKVHVSSYCDESGIILTMVMDYVRRCFLNHPIWKTEVFDMYVQNTHSFGHRAKNILIKLDPELSFSYG